MHLFPGSQPHGQSPNLKTQTFKREVPNLSLEWRGGAIQTEVGVAVVVEEDLEDVEHASHLCEDEDTMSAHF